jgi:DNA-binding PadR family transcriptional regulator
MASGSAPLTRLVVLWLLSEGPLHGYRIKKILDDEALSFWFPIEYASIYTVLRTLVKGGHVRIVAVEREGLRPERTRYAITRGGRRHLTALLERAWREPPRAADPIQLALAARAEVGEERVAELLAARAEALRERLVRLERLARSAPAPEMVGRQRALTRAELEWIESWMADGGAQDAGGTST